MDETSAIKGQFLFDRDMVYLNHGSFGACPKPIFENYQYWQLELEKSPVQFITKRFKKELANSKQILADFIHCNTDDLVFTPNPTYAFNTVIRSLDLQEGEEILATNLEYGAMDRTWAYYCEKSGAKYVQQKITLPLVNKEKFLEEFWAGFTDNTKYIFISHITSSTALILPIPEICKKAKELGLITIIDGAHVPGHIDLNITELDPDYYTGACHKWLLTPKGSTFLYVKRKWQNDIDPLIISWGFQAESPGASQFLDYLEYDGTNDHSAYLTLPKAFAFIRDNNWSERTRMCRKRILNVYSEFCTFLDKTPLCPISEDFLGQICSIPVDSTDPVALKEVLFKEYNIEIPVMKHGDSVFIRISIQPFTSEEDLAILKNALSEIKTKRPDLLS